LSDFEEGQQVQVRYPLSKAEEQGDRDAWPWLPGVIEEVCGPDEWSVMVDLPRLEDGTPAPADADDEDIFYPVCFRDSSELRAVAE
jgi:hypothetical protein